MSSKANSKVYMDIQIGAQGAGRVIFQLFNDLTPKTSQNFRGLCTGQYGKVGNTKLSYLNTKFHRIIDGFVVQGGDITHGGGNGGYSIYGRTFADQNFARTHSCAGLLSMANCGRNTNSSQFFITLKTCPHLDGKHVVFGQVIDGMQVVKKMSKVAIGLKDKPKIPIIIIDCGQVGDFKAFLKYDPFKKQNFEQIKKKKRALIQDKRRMIALLGQGMQTNQAYQMKQRIQENQNQMRVLQKKLEQLENQQQGEDNQEMKERLEPELQLQQASVSLNLRQKLGQKNADKLLDLKLKINQAKVANSKAALQEQIRQSDVNYHKKVKKQQWLQKRKNQEEELIAKGLNKQKVYLNKNALKKDLQDNNKGQSFGWNVFSQDAYYKAYDKRCQALQFDKGLYEKQMGITNTNTNPITNNMIKESQQPHLKKSKSNPNQQQKQKQDRYQKLVNSVNKQIEKRSNFSRRKLYDEGQNVSYINQRNRVFNKKIQRSFGNYASGTKTSLQMNSRK